RSCSRSVQTTAFSVEPRRSPNGRLTPSRMRPNTTITVCPAITPPSRTSASTSRSSKRCSSCPARLTVSRCASARLTALLLVPRLGALAGPASSVLAYPRVETPARICASTPFAPRRHRRQNRFLALTAAHARPLHLNPPASERQLRGRAAPMMMRPLGLVLALRPGQRFGLRREDELQRPHPEPLHPVEQVHARRCHPAHEWRQRRGQRPARLISFLRSFPVPCSLRH